jgi:hypothetical protein
MSHGSVKQTRPGARAAVWRALVDARLCVMSSPQFMRSAYPSGLMEDAEISFPEGASPARKFWLTPAVVVASALLAVLAMFEWVPRQIELRKRRWRKEAEIRQWEARREADFAGLTSFEELWIRFGLRDSEANAELRLALLEAWLEILYGQAVATELSAARRLQDVYKRRGELRRSNPRVVCIMFADALEGVVHDMALQLPSGWPSAPEAVSGGVSVRQDFRSADRMKSTS